MTKSCTFVVILFIFAAFSWAEQLPVPRKGSRPVGGSFRLDDVGPMAAELAVPRKAFVQLDGMALEFAIDCREVKVLYKDMPLAIDEEFVVKRKRGGYFTFKHMSWQGYRWEVRSEKSPEGGVGYYLCKVEKRKRKRLEADVTMVERYPKRFGIFGGNIRSIRKKRRKSASSADKSIRIVFPQEAKPHLFFYPGKFGAQISAYGDILTYGRQLFQEELQKHVYKLKHEDWDPEVWVVNTAHKEIYETSFTWGKATHGIKLANTVSVE